MVSTFIWWKKSVEVLGWWRFSKTRCRWPALLSTPLSRGGKSDVSFCPKVLNEQFGQRDIGVTVLSVTCATERALDGAAVVLFPLFTELGQRNRSKLSEFMDRLPLQWLAILSGIMAHVLNVLKKETHLLHMSFHVHRLPFRALPAANIARDYHQHPKVLQTWVVWSYLETCAVNFLMANCVAGCCRSINYLECILEQISGSLNLGGSPQW